MLAVLVALVVLLVSVVGVYLLLKSMGQDGVEAAAPGSCKSGRCGVRPRTTMDADPRVAQERADQEPVGQIDEIRRKDALSNNQVL